MVLWVEKWLLHRQIYYTIKPFSTYKSNANTTDLCTKLLKTVTVNVLKSNDNRKVSYEMENVVKDSGEGRCFFVAG